MSHIPLKEMNFVEDQSPNKQPILYPSLDGATNETNLQPRGNEGSTASKISNTITEQK